MKPGHIIAIIFIATLLTVSYLLYHFKIKMKADTFRRGPVNAMPDSTLSKRSAESWTMDSIVVYIGRLGRCKKLEDSAKDIYIRYAHGEATYEQYQCAHKIYERYYRNIYEPSYKRLQANSK